MNMRVPDDLSAYEQRIASLESKLRALESQMVERAAATERVSFKTLAEKYGLIGAWLALIVGFALAAPTMLTWPPYASMLGLNAIIVVLTLGLIVPLTAGDFDLSVASTLTLSAMLVAILNVKGGLPISAAVIVALATGVFLTEQITIERNTSRVRVVLQDASTGAVGSVSIPVRGTGLN